MVGTKRCGLKVSRDQKVQKGEHFEEVKRDKKCWSLDGLMIMARKMPKG